ncbi:MAG: phosphoribosylformylglycinamidine synthase subunit PurL, partial [Breznakibacter sp.]|nr:phosphoribosylformylglycinamidine synthase subunit PurL [Breznakibacter sp.]
VDCLNFGSPYNRDVYGEFISSVKALTEVSKRINIPIVAGNVSFFNQRSEEGKLVPIATSPIIGMVGILNNRNHHSTISFKHKGDMIFLLGKSRQCINSSEYAIRVLGIEKSAVPSFSFDEEIELLNVINQLNKRELTRSMHNVGKGGLFFNLLESALPLQFGFDIISDAEIRKDAFLFGEGQGRVVVSVAPEKEDQFVDFMMEMKFPFFSLGLVTKNEISVDDEPFGEISTYAAKIRNSLVKWENGEIN